MKFPELINSTPDPTPSRLLVIVIFERVFWIDAHFHLKMQATALFAPLSTPLSTVNVYRRTALDNNAYDVSSNLFVFIYRKHCC